MAVFVVVGVLVVWLSVFIATALRSDRLIDADAVLLHVGGEGERMTLAMDLWDDHADHLIIPIGSEWDVDDRWWDRRSDHLHAHPARNDAR